MSAIDEEQYLSGAIVVNGLTQPATAANVRAAQPAGDTTYTFTNAFTMVYAGQHLTYRKGQTIHVTPALLTALQARSAPMTLVA